MVFLRVGMHLAHVGSAQRGGARRAAPDAFEYPRHGTRSFLLNRRARTSDHPVLR